MPLQEDPVTRARAPTSVGCLLWIEADIAAQGLSCGSDCGGISWDYEFQQLTFSNSVDYLAPGKKVARVAALQDSALCMRKCLGAGPGRIQASLQVKWVKLLVPATALSVLRRLPRLSPAHGSSTARQNPLSRSLREPELAQVVVSTARC